MTKKKYECMFLVHNKDGKKEHDYLEEHVKELIEKVGGDIVRLGKWDDRPLAYEIEGQRDGIFYLAFLETDGAVIAPLKREAELSEIILRLFVLQIDQVPTEEEVLKRSSRPGRDRHGRDRSPPPRRDERRERRRDDDEKKDEGAKPADDAKPAEGAKPDEGAKDDAGAGSGDDAGAAKSDDTSAAPQA